MSFHIWHGVIVIIIGLICKMANYSTHKIKVVLDKFINCLSGVRIRYNW